MSEFSVDLDSLVGAANGIHDLLNEVSAHRVDDIDCKRAAVGHDRLAGTIHDFCHRWQHGLTALAQDGAQVADRLIQSVLTYLQAEAAAREALANAASGLDPTTGAVSHGREVI